MDIFSKRDGPRAEDVKAKRFISENAGTIRKLADQISGGGFTKMQQDQARRREEPKPDGLIIHDMKAPSKSDAPEPYVKVSLNNRVVLADRSNGRQLHMLGEIRGNSFARRFVLATKANGFFSPLDDEVAQVIAELDEVEISKSFSDTELAKLLSERLGIADS